MFIGVYTSLLYLFGWAYPRAERIFKGCCYVKPSFSVDFEALQNGWEVIVNVPAFVVSYSRPT